MILAIDPGPDESAAVWLDGRYVQLAVLEDNDTIRERLRQEQRSVACVIEYTPPYTLQSGSGRSYVPRQLLDTAVETGRFIETWAATGRTSVHLLSRSVIKKHLLGRTSGTDADVRAAILDWYGVRSNREAKGTKGQPGPLYGVKADMWAALAVAIVYQEILASGTFGNTEGS